MAKRKKQLSHGAEHIEEDMRHMVEESVEENEKVKKKFNNWIYIVGIIGPLLVLPQIFAILFYKTAAGVSFITWTGYLAIAAAWFGYGLYEKSRPIILTYSIWIVLNITVLYTIFFF